MKRHLVAVLGLGLGAAFGAVSGCGAEAGPPAVQTTWAHPALRAVGIASATEAYRRAADRGPKVVPSVELRAE